MTEADIQRTVLAVWRIEQPRLLTSLSRMLRDVPLAEDLTQEALLAAIEHWPATGVPEKPGAWLMAIAKRRALDHLRRGQMIVRKHAIVAWDMEQEQQAMPDLDSALDDDIGDELLRLIFTACHPRLSREARAALALRMICGLTTDEIARAFLLPEATIAQRIVRAKRTLSESGLAYETPRGEELSERLASVLEVVYLIFNEGYTAARGDEWLRPQLCNDALRLGRILAELVGSDDQHGIACIEDRGVPSEVRHHRRGLDQADVVPCARRSDQHAREHVGRRCGACRLVGREPGKVVAVRVETGEVRDAQDE